MRLDKDTSRQWYCRHSSAFLSAFSILFLCLFVSGCARNEALPSTVTQSFEIAFTRHDLPGLLALFTEDAQILPEHGPVITGHSEIESFLKNQMTPVVSFKTDTDMTLVRGDIAVEQGHYTVRDTRQGANIEMGKYMFVWRKVNDDWRIYRTIYNTDVAPKGLATVGPITEDAS